ncbi:CD1871A family CXXC motif-containing protein [Parablautia muri]|uniref:CD1871A family CXXC motif-containing protein n=1 Tax=Parablautia muri TaxID=2320879 RepID=UPI002412815B|nr:CD1871A family CXXC motif-containing protein [Parablautia muri]
MDFYKNRKRWLSRSSLWLWGFLAGILFLGIGSARGQFSVMWRKAVMICMECIGIG